MAGINYQDEQEYAPRLKFRNPPLNTKGGKRKGAGAKPKYSEQTKTVAFRCPLSKVDELKLVVKSKLLEWSVKCQKAP
jgi:hypothetical protein